LEGKIKLGFQANKQEFRFGIHRRYKKAADILVIKIVSVVFLCSF